MFLIIASLKTDIVSIFAAFADKKTKKKKVKKIDFFIDLWFLLVQKKTFLEDNSLYRNLFILNPFATTAQRRKENYLAFWYILLGKPLLICDLVAINASIKRRSNITFKTHIIRGRNQQIQTKILF